MNNFLEELRNLSAKTPLKAKMAPVGLLGVSG